MSFITLEKILEYGDKKPVFINLTKTEYERLVIVSKLLIDNVAILHSSLLVFSPVTIYIVKGDYAINYDEIAMIFDNDKITKDIESYYTRYIPENTCRWIFNYSLYELCYAMKKYYNLKINYLSVLYQNGIIQYLCQNEWLGQ